MGNNTDGYSDVNYNGAQMSGADIGNWMQGQQANYDNKLASMRASQPQRGMAQYNYDRTGQTPGMAALPPEPWGNRRNATHARNQDMFRTQSGQGQNLQAEYTPQSQAYTNPATGGRSRYQPSQRGGYARQSPNQWQGRGQQAAMANALRGRRGRNGTAD